MCNRGTSTRVVQVLLKLVNTAVVYEVCQHEVQWFGNDCPESSGSNTLLRWGLARSTKLSIDVHSTVSQYVGGHHAHSKLCSKTVLALFLETQRMLHGLMHLW